MIGAIGNTQHATGTTWLMVLRKAGYRCQCTGACGATHTAGKGRCPAESPGQLLVAAPADPAATTVTACRVHVDLLKAWCPSCLDGAARAARLLINSQPPTDQLSLADQIEGVPA